MSFTEYEAVVVFCIDTIVYHLLPVFNQFVFHGCSNSEAFAAVLIIALYTDTSFVRVTAHSVLPTRKDLTMHFCLFLILKPHLRQPVDTTNMHPAYICLDYCTCDFFIHNTFYFTCLRWFPIPCLLTLHERDTSQTEPLILSGKPFQKIVSIAAHVHCHVALVTHNEIVSSLFILHIALAHVADNLVLVIVAL